MYTIFRNFLSQYSRRLLSILAQQSHKSKKHNQWFDLFLCHRCNQPLCFRQQYYLATRTVVHKTKKKCGAHTHVHHSFATFFSQYSRQLLSILAQPEYNNQTTTTVICFDESLLRLCFDCCGVTFITCTVVQHKRKKNAEHTRMYAIFRASFSLNIHGGCCLFSHVIIKILI